MTAELIVLKLFDWLICVKRVYAPLYALPYKLVQNRREPCCRNKHDAMLLVFMTVFPNGPHMLCWW